MVLDNVRMPKLQEIFTTVTCMWCHNVTRDSQFCKIFLRLFSFEQAKVLKNLSEKLYTSKIKKKKSVGCPHLVHLVHKKMLCSHVEYPICSCVFRPVRRHFEI